MLIRNTNLVIVMFQIEAFREIKSAHGKITHNFRPIQPIGDRVVYYNIDSNYYVYNNELDESEETTEKPLWPARRKKHRNHAYSVVPSVSSMVGLISALSFVL